jgi:hypothetical protein
VSDDFARLTVGGTACRIDDFYDVSCVMCIDPDGQAWAMKPASRPP